MVLVGIDNKKGRKQHSVLALEPHWRDGTKITLASVVIVQIPGGMRALNAVLTLLLLGTM